MAESPSRSDRDRPDPERPDPDRPDPGSGPRDLPEEALALLAGRFRALGDPTRLRILNTLLEGEISVSELVERTGLGQPSVSRHLAVLRRESIVVRRSEANRAFYRVEDATVLELFRVACSALIDRLSGDLEGLADARAWMGSHI